MPEGLAIDYKRQLNNTMPPYAQHVVIRTGKDDWSKRIEDEPPPVGPEVRGDLGGGDLAKQLKDLVGKGGKHHDPSHPVLITNSSLQPEYRIGPTASDKHTLDLFPQNMRVSMPPDRANVIDDFAKLFLRPERQKYDSKWLWDTQKILDEAKKSGVPIGSSFSKHGLRYRTHQSPTIYICGHMSRDSRCGILGPILREEFSKQIMLRSRRMSGSPRASREAMKPRPRNPWKGIIVGLCSHIGGHAFAGNVIIYFPRAFVLESGGEVSPLAGKGIWYGRVQPNHVEGILEETVQGGKIIQELCRGVHELPRAEA